MAGPEKPSRRISTEAAHHRRTVEVADHRVLPTGPELIRLQCACPIDSEASCAAGGDGRSDPP
jgi:hypothetical protein